MYGVIYAIKNNLNSKIYVGQTTLSIQERFTAHCKAGTLLGKDIRKFSKENFSIEILEECESAEKLNDREIFWIAHFNCKHPNGYNTMNGGGYIRERKNNREQTPRNKKDFILMLIGVKIAYYRTLRRMTQTELADKVHMSLSSIGRIERGTYNNGAPISTLINVADGLGVDLASLVTFSKAEEKILREVEKNLL